MFEYRLLSYDVVRGLAREIGIATPETANGRTISPIMEQPDDEQD